MTGLAAGVAAIALWVTGLRPSIPILISETKTFSTSSPDKVAGMWQTLTGSLTDVNRTNGVDDQLTAEFVCHSSSMVVDATTTAFVTVGERPREIHWRADGHGWIILRSGRQIQAGDNDHDFFDLPKLIWPQRYPALATVLDGEGLTANLDQAAARLLGNGRAHLVTATLDRKLGLIRSYRSQAADGTTLRRVELTYTAT